MMFCAWMPDFERPKVKQNQPVITEEAYFDTDREKLKDVMCPNCQENGLFRGCVYIGCHNCMNYFSEKEIIEANLGGK